MWTSNIMGKREEYSDQKYWRSGETSTDMETWQRDYLTGTGLVQKFLSKPFQIGLMHFAGAQVRDVHWDPLALLRRDDFQPSLCLMLLQGSSLQFFFFFKLNWGWAISFQLELLLLAIETKSDTGKSQTNYHCLHHKTNFVHHLNSILPKQHEGSHNLKFLIQKMPMQFHVFMFMFFGYK